MSKEQKKIKQQKVKVEGYWDKNIEKGRKELQEKLKHEKMHHRASKYNQIDLRVIVVAPTGILYPSQYEPLFTPFQAPRRFF